jgi:hypothetical protein
MNTYFHNLDIRGYASYYDDDLQDHVYKNISLYIYTTEAESGFNSGREAILELPPPDAAFFIPWQNLTDIDIYSWINSHLDIPAIQLENITDIENAIAAQNDTIT